MDQITDQMAYAFHHALTDGPLGDDDVAEIKHGLTAAFQHLTLPPTTVKLSLAVSSGGQGFREKIIRELAAQGVTVEDRD